MMSTARTDLELNPVQMTPFNAESPLPALLQIPTPSHLFYVRSNFAVPQIDRAAWRLEVTGAVAHPIELSFDDLARFESHESLVLLECAGNGRRRMRPIPSGVAWDIGAVSCAHFRGVRLADVLAECGVANNAVEVAFRGADSGEVSAGRVETFERSMPLANALDPRVLLATEMNGAPLPPEHGFPLRLLVPQWYGVASVKWLTRIEVRTEPFVGHFQTERYVYLQDPIAADHEPVREARVRAVLARPRDGELLTAGACDVSGIAWSGMGEIERVEVTVDGGATWRDAVVEHIPGDAAPARFHFPWIASPGEYTLGARAKDAAGNVQPTEPIYNALGYGNNVVQWLKVSVTP